MNSNFCMGIALKLTFFKWIILFENRHSTSRKFFQRIVSLVQVVSMSINQEHIVEGFRRLGKVVLKSYFGKTASKRLLKENFNKDPIDWGKVRYKQISPLQTFRLFKWKFYHTSATIEFKSKCRVIMISSTSAWRESYCKNLSWS